MKKYSIGIDLGGTKILAGVVAKASGEVVFEVKNKKNKAKGNKKVTAKIIETIEEIIRESTISKVEISYFGIGFECQVERKVGV